MRFLSLTAVAFGPLRGRRIELAPGMNVVYGLNEAGKSSWHAALYAGLCGIRRGSGRHQPDRIFAERHRPWEGSAWEVTAVVELAGGRQVELHHELQEKVDCRAIDLDLGTDLTGEIMNEGAPDGSRWLGLDRRAFLATACVRQAKVAGFLSDPGALQEHLQRAAATAGADATAAAALEVIDGFLREEVGLDRANSTRPLRLALVAAEEARARLARARADHAAYLERLAAADDLKGRADQLEWRVRLQEAGDAHSAAIATETRRRRAAELAARYPEGPGPGLPADDKLARRVASAFDGWRRRPAVPAIGEGPTAAALEAEIEGLPPMPEGETEPDPSVVRAERAWAVARTALAASAVAAPAATSTTPEEARARPEPARPGAGGGRGLRWWPWAAGALLGAAALALASEGLWPVAALLLVAGGAGVALGRRRGGGGRRPAGPEGGASSAERPWEGIRGRLEAGLRDAEAALADALRGRVPEAAGGLPERLAAYLSACSERAAQARRAASRGPLAERLGARRGLEEAARLAREAVAAAAAELHAAAAAAGLDGATEEELLARLARWLEDRGGRLEGHERALHESAELGQLLGGGTLADLEAAAEGRRLEAEAAAAALGESEPVAAAAPGQADLTLAEARAGHAEASRAAGEARGEVQEMARGLAGVPEAEEEVAEAEAELARIRALEGTLTTAKRFLTQAQEQVHRDIAPVLARTLDRWLFRVTAGHYRESIVNPATLEVQVRDRDGRWRSAGLLSQATGEQVHLLLRMAMVEHLTAAGEVCPLLLDEVTVQSDGRRTTALLDLLHEISSTHQVILFTQEEHVREWAAAHLDGPCDRLQLLDEAEALPPG